MPAELERRRAYQGPPEEHRGAPVAAQGTEVQTSKLARRIASLGTPPRSYIHSTEECGSSATMTRDHAHGRPCTIAKEASG